MSFLSQTTGGWWQFWTRPARLITGLLVAALFSAACQPDRATLVPLAVAFTLDGGEEVFVQNDGLRIKFKAVEEDNRCPVLVQCVQAGEAVLKLLIQHGDNPSDEISLSTDPATGRTTGEYLNYIVQFRSLNPPPPADEKPLKLRDYRLTLIVFKQ